MCFFLIAAYKGYLKILRYLYTQGANVETKSEEEFSPLDIGLYNLLLDFQIHKLNFYYFNFKP